MSACRWMFVHLSLAFCLMIFAGCQRVPVQISRLAPPAYDIEPGRRLAVLPFGGTFGRDDAGEIVSNALVSHLVPVGYYQVMERAQVKAIIDELNFSRTDYVDPSTAGRLGQMLGADYLVVGTVTAWSVEDSSATEFVSEMRQVGNYYDGTPIMREERIPVPVVNRVATVAADFRLIHGENASIIASSTERESFRSQARGAQNIANIPPREQILSDLAQVVAGRFFSKISAHSVTEGRILFKGKTPQSKQGVDFARNGLWDMAAQQWNLAVQTRPDDFAPLNNLAVYAETQGRFDDAESLYLRALALAPNNQDVQQQLQAVRRVRAETGRAQRLMQGAQRPAGPATAAPPRLVP